MLPILLIATLTALFIGPFFAGCCKKKCDTGCPTKVEKKKKDCKKCGMEMEKGHDHKHDK